MSKEFKAQHFIVNAQVSPVEKRREQLGLACLPPLIPVWSVWAFERVTKGERGGRRAAEAASAPLRNQGPCAQKSQETSHLSVGTINRPHLWPQAQLQPHSFWHGWSGGKEALKGKGEGGVWGGQIQIPKSTLQSSQMPDWVTFVACLVAKEIHRCSLSFASRGLSRTKRQ